MKWNKEQEKVAIDMIKDGKSYKDISEKLERTERSIREKLRMLGYKSSMFDKTKKICKNCKNEYEISIRNKQELNREFCSKSCSATYNNKNRGVLYHCLNCVKELKKNGKVRKYKEYIKMWKNGEVDGSKGESGVSTHIRRYLFDKYNNKCSKCGWNEINEITGKSPLNVEHIDGDYRNNKEENLDLLCPNCHSLTPTYGSLNKGKGRKDRKRRRIWKEL